MITLITASPNGTFAMYLRHQPTSQLHTLVPDGSQTLLRAQNDCAVRVREIGGHASEHVGEREKGGRAMEESN